MGRIWLSFTEDSIIRTPFSEVEALTDLIGLFDASDQICMALRIGIREVLRHIMIGHVRQRCSGRYFLGKVAMTFSIKASARSGSSARSRGKTWFMVSCLIGGKEKHKFSPGKRHQPAI